MTVRVYNNSKLIQGNVKYTQRSIAKLRIWQSRITVGSSIQS